MGALPTTSVKTTSVNEDTRGRLPRRVVVPVTIGVVLFAALWYALLTATTAFIIASGAAIVLVAGPGAAEPAESLLDMLVRAILGILAAVGAFFAAILSIVN